MNPRPLHPFWLAVLLFGALFIVPVLLAAILTH